MSDLDFLNEEIESALDDLNDYKTSSPRMGRPASEEFWQSTKDTLADLLHEDPDTLFHLVKKAVDRMTLLAAQARATIEKLLALSNGLNIAGTPYDPNDILAVRRYLGGLRRVVGSEGGQQRRMVGLNRVIRSAVATHSGSAFIGTEGVKNRQESTSESRGYIDDLKSVHDKLVIIPPAVLTAKAEYGDRGTRAQTLDRKVVKADADLQKMEYKASSSQEEAKRYERATTLKIVATSALIKAAATHVDPEAAKVSGDVEVQAPCVPAEVAAQNQPPYIVDPSDNLVSIDVDETTREWAVPTTSRATARTRNITADNPAVITPQAPAWLDGLTHMNPQVPLARYFSASVTSTVQFTPLAGGGAAGDPAYCTDTALGAIFLDPGVPSRYAFPGDFIFVEIAGPGVWSAVRILSVADANNAIVEIPVGGIGGAPYGPYNAEGVVVDDRITFSVDNTPPVQTRIGPADLEVARAAGHPFSLPIANLVNALNTNTPGALGVFHQDGNAVDLRSPTTGSSSRAAVVEAALFADREQSSVLAAILEIRDRTTGVWQIIITDVNGDFEVGETVTLVGSAATPTVVEYVGVSGILTVDDDPTGAISVTGVTSGATANVDNCRNPPDRQGTDDNRYVQFTVSDPANIWGHHLHGAIAEGTYTTAAGLAAAIQTAVDAGGAWVDVHANDDNEVEVSRLLRGSQDWVHVVALDSDYWQPVADTVGALEELALVPDEIVHGDEVSIEALAASLEDLPVDPVIASETLGTELFASVYVIDRVDMAGDWSAEAGDRLVIDRVARDMITVTTTDTIRVGDTVEGTHASFPPATGVVGEIRQVGPTTFVRFSEYSGRWVQGMSLTWDAGGSTGTIANTAPSAPGDETGPGTYEIVGLYGTTGVGVSRRPRPGLYYATILRNSLGVKSQSTGLDSALQVAAGTVQATMGFPTEEFRGRTNTVKLADVDLTRVIRSAIRVGDIFRHASVDAAISAINRSDNSLTLDTYLDNDLIGTASILALGAVGIEALKRSIYSWWQFYQKSEFVDGLQKLRQYFERSAKGTRWVIKYVDLLNEYDAGLANLQAALSYEANLVDGLTSLMDGLGQHRLEAARDVLASCRIRDFMDMPLRNASDWGLAVSALRNLYAFLPLPSDGEEMDGFFDDDPDAGFNTTGGGITDAEERQVDLFGIDDDPDDGIWGL